MDRIAGKAVQSVAAQPQPQKVPADRVQAFDPGKAEIRRQRARLRAARPAQQRGQRRIGLGQMRCHRLLQRKQPIVVMGADIKHAALGGHAGADLAAIDDAPGRAAMPGMQRQAMRLGLVAQQGVDAVKWQARQGGFGLQGRKGIASHWILSCLRLRARPPPGRSHLSEKGLRGPAPASSLAGR